MKLLAYYISHTFVNQIKKLFKTWMLAFFLICGLLGGLIGFAAASLDNAAPEKPEQTQSEEAEKPPLTERLGVSKSDIGELALGGVILGVLVFCALSADKNGSKIFLPADVNLLFSSPMKPQSVLMFRLTTQMGAGLAACIFMMIQIPNFMEMGLSGWGAAALVLTWALAILVGTLLQVLLYTVCTTRPGMKKYIRYTVFGLLALMGAGYMLYWKRTDLNALQAAAAFFNHPATRYIPIWGWTKGFCMFALEGNALWSILSLCGVIAGGVLFMAIIWHVKADFYEDAMAKSQETAAVLEQAQSDKTVIRKRKKDRSDTLRRDQMHRGWGANIFFWKAMYNRFRFAHFRVFTKTSETYLLTAVGVAAICKFVARIPGLMPVALTLGVFSFFRATANPLEQDTDLDYFRLIPESTWSKLFWSAVGGSVNCLMDLIPGMAAAVLLLGESPLTAILWILFIATVDFFSAVVGAFINLSVPVSAGAMLKRMTAILFIYFGLVPDIGIMAVGIVFDHVFPAALGAMAVNLALGFLFLSMLPIFVDPSEGKKYVEPKPFTGDLKKIRKDFSTLGIASFFILLIGSAAQIVLTNLFPQLAAHPWGRWVAIFAPIYLVAVPLCMMLIRTVPTTPIPQSKMKAGSWITAMLVCAFLMVVGNLTGMAVLAVLAKIANTSTMNPVAQLTMHQALIPKILTVVVIGPIMEEYIFRKQLIDRMHIYGGRLAVVTSAMMFGLFHGNLSQFFYAFLLGLVFGYVYYKTGRLRYSAAMHMLINFTGGVLAPAILEHADQFVGADPAHFLENLNPWMIANMGFNLLITGSVMGGLVMLCVHWKKTSFAPAEMQLPRGTAFKTVYGNVGMVILIAACAALTVLTLIS